MRLARKDRGRDRRRLGHAGALRFAREGTQVAVVDVDRVGALR